MISYPVKNANSGLTVITTHINVDFDALGSMLAAQKLYPEAVVVFPGSSEKKLRNFFINAMVYLFNMVDIKDIDFSDIQRIVLVDTGQKKRIGTFADIVDRPDISVHIYDHHPPEAIDINPDHAILSPTGATVSILTEVIEQNNIELSPEEATLMCLGIYEDTGSFTFSSTTEQDFRAAAFLLSKGASLNTVADIVSREISPTEVTVLNDMILAAATHNINGADIIITRISTDHYVQDLAYLTHKLTRMESLDVIFTLARQDHKVYIVARSRLPAVDVGAVLSHLGGGGHNQAASASVKDMTLAEVENALLQSLYQEVSAQKRAKDIMTSPAIQVTSGVSVKDAAASLARYNVNALLISNPDDGGEPELLGFITRQLIDKLLSHDMGDEAIAEYMTTEIAVVSPVAEIEDIQKKILDHKQRILPVVDNKKILGVITRTDLLNTILKESETRPTRFATADKQKLAPRTKNLSHFMKERLPGEIIELLAFAGRAGDELGVQTYVVGGFVRDLLLYEKNLDIDLVVEGDGIAFAKAFGRKNNAHVHTYQKFGTAVITLPSGFKIDVASARLEYYQSPGALPTVEQGSIKLDMYRRDFTVNTLAIRLNPDSFGTLVDYFSGQKDLKDKVIRVIHNLSFVEDPTRVFRAIRFEQRFGFTIGKLTSGLIENAIKRDYFIKLTGIRIFSEIKHILNEADPVPAVVRLYELKLMKAVHPTLTKDKFIAGKLEAAKKAIDWHDLLYLGETYFKWAVNLLVIIRNTPIEVSSSICDRFHMPPKQARLFGKERVNALQTVRWLESSSKISSSSIYHRLRVFRTEHILFMMAVAQKESSRRAISSFYTQLRHTRIITKGRDLKALGIPEGPLYKEILDGILNAKLNGTVSSKSDEIVFISEFLKNNFGE